MAQDIPQWSAAPKAREKVVIDVRGASGGREAFDLTPFVDAIGNVAQAQKIISKNPYDKGAYGLILTAGKDMRNFLNAPMPTEVAAVLRPAMRHMAGPMMESARVAVELRMHAEHKLIMHPTQTFGATFSAPNAGTATFTIQNPYQGSGATTTFAETLWAITAFESGGLVNTATAAGSLFITSLVFAGHDYVQASTNALVKGSVAGTGGGTIVQTAAQGWGWYIFASDKRERPHTVFSPWNLQGAAGIIGAIMRETGQVTFTFLNQTGSTVYVPFHVHMKASLCGAPFSAPGMREMFVPYHEQMRAAHRLAQWHPRAFENVFRGIQGAVLQADGNDPVDQYMLNDQLFMPL